MRQKKGAVDHVGRMGLVDLILNLGKAHEVFESWRVM